MLRTPNLISHTCQGVLSGVSNLKQRFKHIRSVHPKPLTCSFKSILLMWKFSSAPIHCFIYFFIFQVIINSCLQTSINTETFGILRNVLRWGVEPPLEHESAVYHLQQRQIATTGLFTETNQQSSMLRVVNLQVEVRYVYEAKVNRNGFKYSAFCLLI